MMKMNKILFFLFLTLAPHILFAATAAPGSPMRAIQDLDQSLKKFRSEPPLSEADKAYNRKLKQEILHGTFDLHELTKLSFGKHWSERSEAEQKEVVDLMTSILESQAIFSNEQYAAKTKKKEKYRVVYRSEKFLNERKTKALVKTIVLIPAENVEVAVSYRLRLENKRWKIYDIIIDEASLIDNYRYQFHDIITKRGFEELKNLMKKKLDEIKAKRTTS